MQSVGVSEAVLPQTLPKEARPLGFPLIAAGALAGLVGMAAVLFSQGADGMQRYTYREVAGAALALALMLFLAGSATSLPLGRAPRLAGILGVLVSTAGIAAFVFVYPYLWNTSRDHSVAPVVLYAAGMSLLCAANASGLVAAYVEARAARNAAASALHDDVTDEEVVRDILETTTRQRLTWGGVRTDDRAIELSVDTSGATITGGSLERLGLQTRVAEEALEQDVGALLAFRGVKGHDAEAYDDADAGALARLRAEMAEADGRTWRGRLRAWFARWRGR